MPIFLWGILKNAIACMLDFMLFYFIHCKCLSIRRPYQTVGVTLHFLVLGVIQRAPPSMDTVGEQIGGPMLTDAQRRKIERDKTRVRRGNVQQKRLHVLNNPSKLAFRGWEEVPEPWTYADCEELSSLIRACKCG
jgi:hypothetical protein